MRIAVAVVSCLASLSSVSSVARADNAAQLQAHGEVLAKQGRYTEAIASFKASDKLSPSARNACFIALAYTRRELWPQAELFLQQCHSRASASDPLPDWVPAADTQIAERIANANVALVTIDVTPNVNARLTVSSFELDEALVSNTVHLPFGHHVIVATTPGYVDGHVDVDVTAKDPRHVAIALAPRSLVKAAPPPPPARASKAPWIVAGVGVALALGGAGTDLFWAQPLRTKLRDAKSRMDYDANSKSYDHAADVSYALFGVGAIVAITGVVLHFTVFHDGETIGAAPVAGGAVVKFGWSL